MLNTHVWCTQYAPPSLPAFLSARNVADCCAGRARLRTDCETWTENWMRFIPSASLHMWIRMYVTCLFPCNTTYLHRGHIFIPFRVFWLFILASVYWILLWEIGALRWYFIENIKEMWGTSVVERKMGLASDINSRCDYSHSRQFWNMVWVRQCIFNILPFDFFSPCCTAKREVAVRAK